MSAIDNGIKQPLRFYDDISKQNWRRDWVLTGIAKQPTLINPVNSLLPFQIRRRTSPNPVTTFDLYTFDSVANDFVYFADFFTYIPAPTTTHFFIVQMQTFDNIIWYPKESLEMDLPCGYYYVYVSDGSQEYWSEVFHVVDFTVSTSNKRPILSDSTVTGGSFRVKDSGNYRVSSHNIY